MKTTVLGLALLLTACATQKPYTAQELAGSDNLRLCRIIGWSYWAGDPGAYQLAVTELRKRNAFDQDCANIAQIEFNGREQSAARSQAFAAALGQISRDAQQRAAQPIYQPAPTTSCTSYTQAGVTQTNCH
jgi:hypothetical protein